jgi:hypothetical protein
MWHFVKWKVSQVADVVGRALLFNASESVQNQFLTPLCLSGIPPYYSINNWHLYRAVCCGESRRWSAFLYMISEGIFNLLRRVFSPW